MKSTPDGTPPPAPPPPDSPPPAPTGAPDKPSPPVRRGLPKPPIQTLLFWLVLLFALPLTLYFLNRQGTAQPQELTASEFERYLDAGRVSEVIVVKDQTTGIRTLTGVYRPERKGGDSTQPEPEPRQFQVDVVYTDRLDDLLREHCANRSIKTVTNFWGNVLLSVLPILLLVGLMYFLFSRQMRNAGKGAFQFGKSRARLMQPNQDKVTFKDVAGIQEAKEEVQEIIDFLREPKKFEKLGGRIPKGVLMIGPPGTGKTLLARAIAGEAEVPFFSISGSDFVEMFVGVGASRVRDMFEEGKRHAPCLIFIDEIDAVGRSRFSGIGGGHDEREQTLNALLVEMDGFEANAGIIVIAATNRPDVLDPALLRPGRFDRQISIDLPDLMGRLGILKVHAAKIKLGEGIDLETVARGTPGFSGADLANLINEAALLAARLNKTTVEMSDLEEARDKVRWGKERRSRKIDERDRRVTAYHEAGHALVGLLCTNAMPLHKVTIIPRGNAYLGATMHLPEQDRYTQTRGELEAELAVLMGGRLAEQLIFNEITSGAAMDIHQATTMARKMVCQWGMSDAVGPLSYVGREEPLFLGRDMSHSKEFSEATGRELDNEIRRIVRAAESRARELLTTHLDRLKKLGEALLARETMGVVEIRDLLDLPAPANGAAAAPGTPAAETPDTADRPVADTPVVPPTAAPGAAEA